MKNSLLLYILCCIPLGCCLGLGCGQPGYTTKQDAGTHNDTIENITYEHAREELTDSLKVFINKKEGPYYPAEYDGNTQVFIDSILFSPDKKRVAFFAITQNANDKLIGGGKSEESHFNAHCFIGDKTNSDSTWNIHWLSAVNIINYKTYQKASRRIREAHFESFDKREGVDGKSLYKYNLTDKRFWNGPVWEK